MKKALAFILCVVMLVSVLVACGSGGDSQETQKQTDNEGNKETETKENRLPVNLPDTKYNDSFDVLHWTVTEGWIPWEEVTVETMTGDTMDDSIFQRNAAVAEMYDITFSVQYEHTNDVTSMMKNNVASGDDTYDLVCQRAVSLSDSYTDGIWRNWQDVPYVDFTQPWWNQDSVRSLALGDLQQFVASDMLLLDKGATASLFFNAPVAEQKQEVVGDLYQLVRDNEWTMEKFEKICEDVSEDRDGDGIYNGENDLIGMTCVDDPVHFLYTGAGLRFMDRTSDGHFEYLFGESESIEIMQEILDDVMAADWLRNTFVYPWSDNTIDKFRANETLFTCGAVKTANNLRQNESDYGVLPIPKYDDGPTTKYCSEVSPHHDTLLCIPGSVKSVEFVGAVVEALSYEAHYTSYPTFYDVIITGRSIRDQASKEMLEIIFTSRVYDAGLIYDLDHFANAIVLRATAKPGLSIATTYASYMGKLEKRLEELNKMIDQLNAQ